MDAISSGIDELDAITGIDGFPSGAIVELSGLSAVALEELAGRITKGSGRSSPVHLAAPHSEHDWQIVEDGIRAGSDLLLIPIDDAVTADWLADPERIRRLRGLATEYRMVVVVAVGALLRFVDVTKRRPQGLAAAADIRILLSSHRDQPDQITAQAIKNQFSRPGSEALLRLGSD